MPFPIIAAITLALAAKQQGDQAKQGAMASAAQASQAQLTKNAGVTMDMMPSFDTGVSPGAEPAGVPPYAPGQEPPSAHGRTLEELYSPTKTLGMPPEAQQAGEPQFLSQGGMSSKDINAAPDQTVAAFEAAQQAPGTMEGPTPKGEGALGGMTGLEMAQLGLMLGSAAFQGTPGPAPPARPSGGSFSMKPVFRG